MTPRETLRFLLVGAALTVAFALVYGEDALAQEPQKPTELWEEYPLDPEQDPSPRGGDAAQPRDPHDQGAPPDSGDDATDDEGRPLLQLVVVVGMGLLLLVVACGLGLLALGRDASRPLDRLAATRRASGHRSEVQAASRAGKRAEGMRNKPTTAKESRPVAPVRGTKASRQKPPRAKPPRPAKPRAAKPAAAAKPPAAVKPAGPPKPGTGDKAAARASHGTKSEKPLAPAPKKKGRHQE